LSFVDWRREWGEIGKAAEEKAGERVEDRG